MIISERLFVKKICMKIAIEAQRIFRSQKHGMDFVALEMIRELQKIDTKNEYRIYVSKDEDRCLNETANFKIIELPSRGGYPVWEQWRLARAVNQWKPDLLHCTSNTAPLFVKCKLVITLHDIIFLEKKHDAGKVSRSVYQTLGNIYRRYFVPPVLHKASKIITVSKFEQERISESLQLPDGKLTVVYNGYGNHFYPQKENSTIRSKYNLPDCYYLFLGNTDPKKNTQRVLKAYGNYIRQSKKPIPLVVADLNEKLLTGLAEWDDERFRENLIMVGYIPNVDLPYIYSMANAFLYTSLRESFGIPILEAMACGTPVITSSTSAMPEIAGKGAILLDPYNEKEIADQLLIFEKDQDLILCQISYGLDRVKHFSWRSTAEQVFALYNEIINPISTKR